MNAIKAIWNYFQSMNAGPGGGVSIKRNIAWGIATLLVWVEVYSVMKLIDSSDSAKVIDLCKFYAIVDAIMILLTLGITSIEKISDLIQRIKGGIASTPTTVRPQNEPQ